MRIQPEPPLRYRGRVALGCKYTHFDPLPGSTHNLVLELVPPKSSVLEFGCATGYMSEVLATRLDCTVVGLEIDPEAAELARAHCEEVIVGDADTLDYEEVLGDRRFDAVLFAVVLEHLRDPGSVLERIRPFLAEDGIVVASVPNIAHGSVRLALLGGEFRYRRTGLMDDTHLHFMTRETLQELFEGSGYLVTDWVRQCLGIDDSEISYAKESVPPGVREWLERDPEATTYQFVVRAVPSESVPRVHPREEADERAAAAPAGSNSVSDPIAENEWFRRAVLRIADAPDLGGSGPVSDEEPPLEGRLDAASDQAGYEEWLERTRPDSEARRAELLELLAELEEGPRFSVVLPADSPDPRLLERSVASLRAQLYENWELSALGEAAGDFVAFLAPGDELAPEALAELAVAITDDPAVDVLYTDEDEIDERGNRTRPFLKPDWSPDYLLSFDYVGRLFVVRRELLEGLGSEVDENRDYDLALRATERAERVGHVPKILYHRRAHSQSEVDPESGRRALQDALHRRGEDAQAFGGSYPPTYRVRRRQSSPLVSVVIPFKDGADLLRGCLDGLHRLAGYDRWEALLVDNGSWEPETQALLRLVDDDPKCRPLEYDRAFNWSAVNNWAVEQAAGEVLLFLNNDVEGFAHGWLQAMVEHALRPEVGAVGARLLYPDGRIQHAGVLVGVGSVADHAFRFSPAAGPGYFYMPDAIRNYTAVTGACMMVRRDTFDELGGFDEDLAVAYNDIDFCLRLRERGYLIVYTPFAELLHHESVSRGRSTDTAEARIMLDRWGDFIKDGDPYFNPNLSRRSPDCALPLENEVTPWEILTSSLKS